MAKHKEEIINITEKQITEIIEANKNNISDIPIIPNQLQTIITQVRTGIPHCDKDKWYTIECLLDKVEQITYREIKLKTKKKKLGRPKKNGNNHDINIEKEIESMAKFLGLDDD